MSIFYNNQLPVNSRCPPFYCPCPMFEKRALPANAHARFWGMWQCLCPPARLFYYPFQHQQLTQTFYFTPLKTYHPRLLHTYKKVIPSCFFGNTQNSKSPTTSPFPFLFLLILSLANSILKTSLIFLGFQPQNHTKEAKFLTNCGAVRVWSERSALQAVHIEYILMHCS